MSPNEYTNALEKAIGDLENKVLQRDLLNGEIFGLKETVRVLASRVNLSAIEQDRVARLIAMVDSATPKLTDAIRSLLVREHPRTMTAIEVRNALEDGSDSEGISLSACHAALKRMLVDKEVEAGPTKDGKASYRIVLRLAPQMNANAYSNIFAEILRVSPPDAARAIPEESSRRESWRGRAIPEAEERKPGQAPRPPNWKGGLPAPLKK